MKVLLDTAPFLWAATDAAELSATARAVISDPGEEVLLSAVSCWEISVKHSLGKLELPESPERLIPAIREEYGIDTLPLDQGSALQLERLPRHHADPFDRLLICQAVFNGLAILTPDELIRRYPVRTIW